VLRPISPADRAARDDCARPANLDRGAARPPRL